MRTKMTVGTKLNSGFGLLIVLLVSMSILAIYFVHRVVNLADRMHTAEQLRAEMMQREIDHLKWAAKVNVFLDDDDERPLDVETDPHKCGLGKWFYGEGQQLAVSAFPELAGQIAKLEAPHKALHAAAVKIEALKRDGDPGEAQRVYEADVLPPLASVQKALHSISSSLETEVGKERKQMKSNQSRANAVIIGGSVIAALIAVLSAFLIGKTITGPLRTVIATLRKGSDQVGSASNQVASSSQSMAQGANEQASSLEEISSSLEEMSSMTQQNAANAGEANSKSKAVANEAESGQAAIERLQKAIQEIQTSAEETAKVIKTIDEIAFQTNLLALNAAVEAARAGEAGRGFAVVAEEVRNLAQRSAEAARETAVLIQGSRENATHGVAVVEETTGSFQGISDGIRKVFQLIAEVATASQEQSSGIEQVNTGVAQINQVTQENAANAEETASASEQLSAQSKELEQSIDQLRRMIERAA